MPHKDYREESRKNWGEQADGNLCREQLETGCLLRIADATEKMAANYTALQEELDRFRRWWKEGQEESARLSKTISRLRGYITFLKKKGK